MGEPLTEAGRLMAASLHTPLKRDSFEDDLATIVEVERQAASIERERLREGLAKAVALVFAYNESNASVSPDGALSFGGEPTSYWRDRADAILELLDCCVCGDAAYRPHPLGGRRQARRCAGCNHIVGRCTCHRRTGDE